MVLQKISMNGPLHAKTILGRGKTLGGRLAFRFGKFTTSQFYKCNRYFKKFEQYTHHAKYPDLDISTKGDKGPVRVGYFSTISEASDLFIKSCTQVGIPFSPDFNGPTGTRGVNRV